MRGKRPFWFTPILLALGLAAFLFWFGLPSNLVFAWYIAINIVTLATYRYDKMIAGGAQTRIPEWMLHLLVVLGGGIGALLGMHWPGSRHKVNKPQFQLIFWLLFIGYHIPFLAAVYRWFW